jgi:hypothetical protein
MYNLFSLFGHIENIKEEDLTHFTYKLDYTLTSTALTIHVANRKNIRLELGHEWYRKGTLVRIVIVVQKVVWYTVVSSINLSH